MKEKFDIYKNDPVFDVVSLVLKNKNITPKQKFDIIKSGYLYYRATKFEDDVKHRVYLVYNEKFIKDNQVDKVLYRNIFNQTKEELTVFHKMFMHKAIMQLKSEGLKLENLSAADLQFIREITKISLGPDNEDDDAKLIDETLKEQEDENTMGM